MERRKEPRFQVYAWAKVTPLDDPTTEIDGHLIDISGVGLRVIADVAFEPDQMIVVETDQHLILADVRNCIARGNRFSVGAERVHSAAKVSIPETLTRAERSEALVEEYRRRLLKELPKAEPAVRPVSNGVAEPHVRSFSLEAPEPRPQTATMLADPQPQTLAAARPVELTLHTLSPAPFQGNLLILPSKLNPIYEDSEPAARDEAVAAEPETPLESLVPTEPVEPVVPIESALPADSAEPLEAVMPMEPALPIEPDKPEDSLRKLFLDQTPPPPKTKSPWARIFAVVLCALAAVALLVFGPAVKRLLFPAPAAAQNSPVAVSIPAPQPVPLPAPVVPAAAPVAAPAAPNPAPAPAAPTPVATPKATPSEPHVSITTNESSWVTACSDGKVLFTRIMPRGGKEDFGFSKRGIIRLGNAGPVDIVLNGKPLGSLGRQGQLRAIELTPDGWSFLLLRAPDGCTQ